MKLSSSRFGRWLVRCWEQPSWPSFRNRSLVMAVVLTATCISGIKYAGGWQRLELFAYDQLSKWARTLPSPPEGPDNRIVIVGISEGDLRRYGWPLSDEIIAELLRTIQIHQPRVVGLDLYRSGPQLPGQSALTEQLAADNLVAVRSVGNPATGGDRVASPAAVPAEQVGFNDLVIDPDGVVRRALLYVGPEDQGNYSFALRVAQQYFPDLAIAAEPDALVLADRRLPALRSGDGGYQTIDARGYQILLRYRSRAWPARIVSAQDILENRFQPDWLRNNIVLIGSVAPSLKDQFYTPFSAEQSLDFTQAGVVIHAHMISQLLAAVEGQPVLYRFLPQWGELCWLLIWIAASSGLTWYLKRPLVLLVAGGSMVAAIWLVGSYGLAQNLWLPTVEPTAGFILAGALVTAQKALYRSTYDSLSGLPGRELFLIQVQQALCAHKGTVSVAFLDLDRFRLINQSFSHGTGDRVLQILAKRLQQVLPAATSLARVGGDEFAILFEAPRETVEESITAIQTTFANPISVEHYRLSVTVSVGLAVVQAGYEAGPEELLRDAHTAMYRAKALQEYRCETFATDMRQAAMERLHLESSLLTALDNQEFLLHYQPIIDLQTGQLSGFEALVRWLSPGQGMVSPAEFMPIVEETGLILPLGQWIFQRACRQLQLWQQEFPEIAPTMSINLSRRQLRQPNLVGQIESILAQTGIDGTRIQLEITESLVMQDVEAARELMFGLKRLGLRLAIDDFGTGYSSLSYLHKFPTDTLKVDQSFVSRIDTSREDWEIVQTILALGRKLNMTLVAEGIEKPSHVALLRRLHCESGQGYFFSRPLTGEQATALLRQDATWSLPSLEASDESVMQP